MESCIWVPCTNCSKVYSQRTNSDRNVSLCQNADLFPCQQLQGLFSSIFNLCCQFRLEKCAQNIKTSCRIRGCLDVCDCIKTGKYNNNNDHSPARLQTFYFISFLLVLVYAWKSKSAIQGWRAAPPGAEVSLGRLMLPLETGNNLEPIMTHSVLPWFHRISAQRQRPPCPCMWLCGKCMPVHTTVTLIVCLFTCIHAISVCLTSQVDPHCSIRRLRAHSLH